MPDEIEVLGPEGGGEEGGQEDGGELEELSPEGEGEGSGEGGEGPEGGEEGQGEPQPGGRPEVARQNAAIRKHIAEIKAANPDLHKALNRMVGKLAQVDQLGTMAEITAAKELLETYGGAEGLQKLAESMATYDTLEQGFERGDPKVIEGWASDYPAGFAKLVLPAFDKLKTVNKEQFESVRASVSHETLEEYGVYAAMRQLGDLISALAGNEAAAAKFNEIARFMGQVSGMGKAARRVDPAAEARNKTLDEREQGIAASEMKAFKSGVRAEVNRSVTAQINREIRKIIGNRPIRTDTFNRMSAQINAELARLVNTQQGYAKDYENVMNSKNHARAAAFVVRNAQKFIPRAVTAILRDFNYSRGPAQGRRDIPSGEARRGGTPPGRTANRSASANNRTIQGKPKADAVDWTRTDKAQWISPHGRAYGKNGAVYQW